MSARTPYNIRKIMTRVTVEGADVKHVQHSQDNIIAQCLFSSLFFLFIALVANNAYIIQPGLH